MILRIPASLERSRTLHGLVIELTRRETNTITTAAARATRLGIRADLTQRSVCKLGSAVVLADRAAFQALVKSVTSTKYQLLMFVGTASRDETPMTIRMESADFDHRTQNLNQLGKGATGREVSQLRITETKIASDTAPAKLFQSRVGMGMLVNKDA